MATKATSSTGETSSSTTFPNVSIQLKDGTQLDVIQNGTTYESGETVEAETLSDDNLSEVTIDGTTYYNMKRVSLYPWDGGSRFSLREMTEQEIENKDLKEQLSAAEQAVAELTTVVSGLLA